MKSFRIHIMFSAMLLALLLAACSGSRSVSDDAIKAYLSRNYYDQRNLKLTEIKDVVEEKGETKNSVIVTCTASANNSYVEKTTNWTMQFEKMDGEWYGKGLQMGLDRRDLHTLSEAQFADIAFENYYSYVYFDIDELNTDSDTGTAQALCTQYENHSAYYTQQSVQKTLRWDEQECIWYPSPPGVIPLEDETAHLKVDLAGNYSFEKNKLTLLFTLDHNPNNYEQYIMSNFYCDFELGSWYQKYKVYTLSDEDSTVLDFKRNYNYYDVVLSAPFTCKEEDSYSSSSSFALLVAGDELCCHTPFFAINGLDPSEVVLQSGLHGDLPFRPEFQGQLKQQS